MMPTRQVKQRTTRYWIRASLWAAALAVCATRTGSHAETPHSMSRPVCLITSFTEPSNRATLGSMTSARIASFPIAAGSAVHAGDVVVALDDTVQRTRTNIAHTKADSDLRLRLALAKWRQAQHSVDREVPSRENSEHGLPSANVEVARLQYELEVYEHSKATLQWQHEQHILDQFQILAPFDGHVYDHLKHAGETTQSQEPLITLIRIDPLLVQLDCPVALAPFVMTGDRFIVTPENENWSARTGTVTRIGRVIDQDTETFRVELSVENRNELWRSGLKISVDLYAPVLQTFDRHTSAQRPTATKGKAPG